MSAAANGTSPQSLVEHALATSTADDTVVIVRNATSANLRWANNTLTTNGVMHGVQVTVIAFVDKAGGRSVGSVSGSASTQAQVTELVEAAAAAARAANPAEDANELVRDGEAPDWDDEPGTTDIHVYDHVAPGLGEAFGQDGEQAGHDCLKCFRRGEGATVRLVRVRGMAEQLQGGQNLGQIGRAHV